MESHNDKMNESHFIIGLRKLLYTLPTTTTTTIRKTYVKIKGEKTIFTPSNTTMVAEFNSGP